MLLQAPVVTVAGDQRLAPTRLEALCFVVRVRATLHLFLAVLGGIEFFLRRFYAWVAPVTARVLHTPPSGMSAPPPLAAVCFGLFCLCVLGVSLLFLRSQPACGFGSNFMGLFVRKVLDMSSFFRE
jgi:hypothetical protein